MLLIDNGNSHDSAFNLALEEYCLLNLPIAENYLLLYVNAPSIVIGKHQNAMEEINTDFVEERGIPVLRRISGGGAVYHDLGNLNYSFIRKYDRVHFNNYTSFTGTMASALRELGVPAVLNARNDILVDGRKVSGSAQAVRRDRMASHGTLLFRSDLDEVIRSLKPKAGKITSKGRPSVRSSVVNIGDFLPADMDLEAFRNALLRKLFPGTSTPPQYKLTSGEIAQVEKLATGKYRTWEWNYGGSPAFTLQRTGRLGTGQVEVRLSVKEGLLRSIEFLQGDSRPELFLRLEQALIGTRYRRDDLHASIWNVLTTGEPSGLGVEEVVRLLY